MAAPGKIYGIDIEAIYAAALQQAVGGQNLHYSTALRDAIPSPALQIEVGADKVVKYRAAFSGAITVSANGLSAPSLAAPTINVQDPVTAADANVVIYSTSEPTRRIVAPVSAVANELKLLLNPPLDGTASLVQALGLMVPPQGLDVGAAPGGTLGTLQSALRLSMENPPGRQGRIVHGPNAAWSDGYPQPTWYPPEYTQQIFTQAGLSAARGYGPGNLKILPWMVFWDEATTAYGTAHVTNPANRKVALHLRDWYTLAHYSDTNSWVVTGPLQLTSNPEMYDGGFGPNSNQPAGVFPPSQRVTWSDGTKGARLINETGITSKSQVRMQHSWSSFYFVPAARHQYLDGFAIGFKGRLEPVITAEDGTAVNGTAADVANARILCWSGADHYPVSGTKPDIDAIMQGRPTYVTGEWAWFSAWVKDGLPLSQSWIDAHPVPL